MILNILTWRKRRSGDPSSEHICGQSPAIRGNSDKAARDSLISENDQKNQNGARKKRERKRIRRWPNSTVYVIIVVDRGINLAKYENILPRYPASARRIMYADSRNCVLASSCHGNVLWNWSRWVPRISRTEHVIAYCANLSESSLLLEENLLEDPAILSCASLSFCTYLCKCTTVDTSRRKGMA